MRDCMHFRYQFNGDITCMSDINTMESCIPDINTMERLHDISRIERLHAFHDTYIVCVFKYAYNGVATMFTKLFFTHSQ